MSTEQSSAATAPQITVVITTKNRKDDLRRAIASCLKQTIPVEVLVMDDGSSDGTPDMVRGEFPTVRFSRNEKSLGLVTQRNRSATLVTTPILISLDDDAYFPSERTVEQTLKDFDHPRIAVVDIPMLDHVPELKEPRRPISEEIRASETQFVLREFHGGVSAHRRDLFLAIGGYHDEVIRQGEERDLSLRLLDAGYVVRAGRGELIHHHPSPARDFTPTYFYGRRSDVLQAWWNAPVPYVFVLLAGTTIRGLITGLRKGYLKACVRGLWRGYVDCWRGKTRRRR